MEEARAFQFQGGVPGYPRGCWSRSKLHPAHLEHSIKVPIPTRHTAPQPPLRFSRFITADGDSTPAPPVNMYAHYTRP